MLRVVSFDIRQGGGIASIGQQIDVHDAVRRVATEPVADEIRANETSTARDQKPHSAHYPSMTSLIIGASGLVGGALLRALGATAVGTYRSRPLAGLRQLDVTNTDAVGHVLRDVRPQVVYFPAAEPNVDWCETHPSEAHATNVAPALAALDAVKRSGARFVFFSTDYVFDGQSGPYAETDAVNPRSVYAKHKRLVEESVLDTGDTVVRTTTVYGREIAPGKNFVLRMVARIRAGETVTAPSDQVSTPTWADELAIAVVAVADRGGIWHVAGPDLVARDDFARHVARVFALDEGRVKSVTTAELRQAAPRPLLGGLRTSKLNTETGITLLPLHAALKRFRDSL
jgi:dTDP-4-dehydrorhamnose reductase